MANSTITFDRVTFRDRAGNFCWFAASDAEAEWAGAETSIIEGFGECVPCMQTLYRLKNGTWVLVHREDNRPTNVELKSDSEAATWLIEAGHELPEALQAVAESFNVARRTVDGVFAKRSVYDSDQNRNAVFDPTGCQHWGPICYPEDWSPMDDYYLWQVEERMYRHPSNHWTLIREKTFIEAPMSSGEDASRMSDEQAAHWLHSNGFEVPADLMCFAEKLTFDPAAKSQAPAGPPKPAWDVETGRLTFSETVIRQVRPNATNVILILTAFQEDGWPARIDNPFPPSADEPTKRRDAVKILNQGLQAIVFECDGREGITWKLRADESEYPI